MFLPAEPPANGPYERPIVSEVFDWDRDHHGPRSLSTFARTERCAGGSRGTNSTRATPSVGVKVGVTSVHVCEPRTQVPKRTLFGEEVEFTCRPVSEAQPTATTAKVGRVCVARPRRSSGSLVMTVPATRDPMSAT